MSTMNKTIQPELLMRLLLGFILINLTLTVPVNGGVYGGEDGGVDLLPLVTQYKAIRPDPGSSCEYTCETEGAAVTSTDAHSELAVVDALKRTQLTEICRRGCRLFTIVASLDTFKNFKQTQEACNKSCMDAYTVSDECMSCQLGCRSQVPDAHKTFKNQLSDYESTQISSSLSPFRYVHNAYGNMADKIVERVRITWSYYQEVYNGGMVVVRSDEHVEGDVSTGMMWGGRNERNKKVYSGTDLYNILSADNSPAELLKNEDNGFIQPPVDLSDPQFIQPPADRSDLQFICPGVLLDLSPSDPAAVTSGDKTTGVYSSSLAHLYSTLHGQVQYWREIMRRRGWLSDGSAHQHTSVAVDEYIVRGRASVHNGHVTYYRYSEQTVHSMYVIGPLDSPSYLFCVYAVIGCLVIILLVWSASSRVGGDPLGAECNPAPAPPLQPNENKVVGGDPLGAECNPAPAPPLQPNEDKVVGGDHLGAEHNPAPAPAQPNEDKNMADIKDVDTLQAIQFGDIVLIIKKTDIRPQAPPLSIKTSDKL